MAGHGRLLAAKKLGLESVPCLRAEHLTPAQIKAYRIADNKLAESEWFPEILTLELKALDEMGFDLSLTGFDPDDLDAMGIGQSEAPPEDPGPQIDRAAELQEKWGTALGQIWQVGRHRVMCGDSTSAEDVGRLLGDAKPFVFSDPPYGVDIVCTNKAKGSIGFGGALGFVGAGGLVPANAYHPIIGDKTTEAAADYYRLCIEMGIKDFVLWGGNYFTAFLPASPCWLIWDKREEIPSNNFADCEMAWTSFDKPARIYRHLWSGLLRKGNRKDELVGRVHPTQKPVGLAQSIMQDFPADSYFDGFLGSGSFLISAENAGKQMFGMELSPEYVAVILERATGIGLTPELIHAAP